MDTLAAVGAGLAAVLSKLQGQERAVEQGVGSGPAAVKGSDITANLAHFHLVATE